MLRLAAGHKYCVLGDLSHQVGWKHKEVVASLEAKRQEAASEYWAKKKEANAKYAAAKEAANAQLGDLAPLVAATAGTDSREPVRGGGSPECASSCDRGVNGK